MNIYEKLGINTIINASDTYTRIGGSRMPAKVVQAMSEAADGFIDMSLLMNTVCARIAKLTQNEAAFITSGAAAGVVLSATACMTGDNHNLMEGIPKTEGFTKNEFLMFGDQCSQILPYWHLVEISGARLIKVGPSIRELLEQINEKTAGVFYFTGTLYETNIPTVEETVSAVKDAGVNMIIDAAAQLPPATNMWYYTKVLGADLAIFSGGKYIMGPQSSGLILGRKDLIESCKLNACPNVKIGRAFKVGKEEIIGLYTAIELFLSEDPGLRKKEQTDFLVHIQKQISESCTVDMHIEETGRLGQTIPMLIIRLPAGKTGEECYGYLYKTYKPAIDIGYYIGGDTSLIYINPINLRMHELNHIADGIVSYLKISPPTAQLNRMD